MSSITVSIYPHNHFWYRFIDEEFLSQLKSVIEFYEQEDPLKYDSFIRVIKGRYECLVGYERIKANADDSHTEEDDD